VTVPVGRHPTTEAASDTRNGGAVQALYQLFWMFLCLYVLPSKDGYKVTTKCDYFKEKCYGVATASHKVDAIGAAGVCNVLTACGLKGTPCGTLEHACSLVPAYNGTLSMPENLVPAICFKADSCPQYDIAKKVIKTLDKDYVTRVEKDMERALSVLFNAFVFMQVMSHWWPCSVCMGTWVPWPLQADACHYAGGRVKACIPAGWNTDLPLLGG
jgi:hypothetical protein